MLLLLTMQPGCSSQSAEPATPAEPGSIRVRFVNTPDGKDVVTAANEGENLMKVRAIAGQYLVEGEGPSLIQLMPAMRDGTHVDPGHRLDI